MLFAQNEVHSNECIEPRYPNKILQRKKYIQNFFVQKKLFPNKKNNTSFVLFLPLLISVKFSLHFFIFPTKHMHTDFWFTLPLLVVCSGTKALSPPLRGDTCIKHTSLPKVWLRSPL